MGTKISELIEKNTDADGTEYIEIIISPYTPGTNRKLAIQKILNVVAGAWGGITGTLSDQTDLQDALNDKSDFLVTTRTETASHTLDGTDLTSINAGAVRKIRMNVASANNLTIPLNATQAFPIGGQIIIQQIGVGQTSIVATGGVTINSANGWLNIAYQFSSVVLTKVGTNEWDLEGTLAP